MKKIKLLYTMLAVLTLLTACNDWLDIQPSTQLNESQMFSTEDGYQDVISGVYRNMSEFPMYGKEMTWGFGDARAQYYERLDTKYYYDASILNYEYASVVSMVNGIWSSAYRQIAELNNVLKHLDMEAGLHIKHRDFYKGEALALRALLHFDLARLFGPNYTDDNASSVMPYCENFDRKAQEHESLELIYGKVIRDLEQALALFKTTDPILGVALEDDRYFKERTNKMNYFAATALMARVYHSMGQLDKAVVYAAEVIQNQGRGYGFVNPAIVAAERTETLTDPVTGEEVEKKVFEAVAGCDRLFSTEVLFGLPYVGAELYNIAQISFEGDISNHGYTRPYGDVNLWYEEDRDIRFPAFYKEESGIYRFIRYQKDARKLFRPAIIRLPEMYFIAMEYYNQTDIDKAVELYNYFREKRGASKWPEEIVPDQLSFFDELVKERRREFPGDGQMAYFYKLHHLSVEINDYVIYDFEPAQWICPLPENEIIYGNN